VLERVPAQEISQRENLAIGGFQDFCEDIETRYDKQV
jgi:hypothetical protein